MNPTHKQIVAELYKAYRAIDDAFLDLIGQCQNDGQKNDVRAAHKAASDAYWKAEAELLSDNNSLVIALRDEIKADTKTFNRTVKKMEKIAESIEIATRIARAVASVVTLAAV